MGIPCIVYGKSGAGKSRSLKNFGEEEIFFVNVEQKPLPFRKKFKYTLKTYDVNTIMDKLQGMSKVGLKTAVVDDAGFIMTYLFMSRHRNMKGNQSFEMYNDIADAMYNLIENIKWKLPEDTVVYLLFHEDVDSNTGNTCVKTLGKLLSDKVSMEGMVTIAIRAMSADGKHYFRTVTDGSDITKAPEEMFKEQEMENDLKAVDTAIREYYQL